MLLCTEDMLVRADDGQEVYIFEGERFEHTEYRDVHLRRHMVIQPRDWLEVDMILPVARQHFKEIFR